MTKRCVVILAALVMLAFVLPMYAQNASVKPAKIIMKGTDGEPSRTFSPSVKAKRKYNIAVVVKSQAIPVWESHLIAAGKAGQAMGVNILPYAPSKADNIEEQKRILEDLVTKGVDCVVLAPANSQAVQGPVAALVRKGVPVVYDNTLGAGDDYLAFVGVDSLEAGRAMGKAVGEGMGGKGKLLILEGVPGQQTSDDRVRGIKEYVSKNFPAIQFRSVAAHWQFNEGRQITEDTLQNWPDLNGIVSPGGMAAEGAAEAIAAAGRTGKVFIGNVDVNAPTKAAIKEGKLAFTISQGVYEQGYWSVAACVKALNGEPVPRKILTPMNVVTKANLDKFDESPEVLKKR